MAYPIHSLSFFVFVSGRILGKLKPLNSKFIFDKEVLKKTPTTPIGLYVCVLFVINDMVASTSEKHTALVPATGFCPEL